MEVIKSKLLPLRIATEQQHLPSQLPHLQPGGSSSLHYAEVDLSCHHKQVLDVKNNKQQLFSFPISVQATRTAVTDTSCPFPSSLSASVVKEAQWRKQELGI